MENVWNDIRHQLAQTVDNASYDMWLAHLKGDFNGGVLTVRAGMELDAAYVRQHFSEPIALAATRVCGGEVRLEFKVEEGEAAGQAQAKRAKVLAESSGAGRRTEESRVMQANLPVQWSEMPAPFKTWKYVFDNFVVGPCNSLACEAARWVGQWNLRDANLLFLYSGPGLGKTHLLQSIGAALSSSCNMAVPHIEYMSAEEFATIFRHVVWSKNDRLIQEFKTRLRGADALLLEDVQRLQPMTMSQNELLDTINAVLDKGGKVGFSCSCSPGELRDMNEQLLSRLGSGLTVPIDPPDLETRRRIILRKASERHLPLSDEIAEYLAESLNSDIRRIESCIKLLALKATLVNGGLSPAMVRGIMSAHLERVPPTLPNLTRLVGEAYGMPAETIRTAKSRKREYVRARYLVFYLARKYANLTYQEMGAYFNNMAHTSVIKGVRDIERELSCTGMDGRLAKTIAMIEANGKLSPHAANFRS